MLKKPSLEKRTFSAIFIILALSLPLLPFLASFNNLLTNFVLKFGAYKVLEDFIVPVEIQLIGVLLTPFGLKPSLVDGYLALSGSRSFFLEIVWNCVGWQSLLFFIITALVGFSGNYTKISKSKTLVIGLLGTFWINLIRITTVVLFAYYFGQFPAIIFHDYGSTLIVVAWLFFFWWFSYGFVLEPRTMLTPHQTVRGAPMRGKEKVE